MTDTLYRPAVPADALCLGVLATQVFLDTYATQGIRTALAREVQARCSTQAFDALLADDSVTIIAAERALHLVGFALVAHGVASTLLPDDPAAELRRLYVQEPFTGMGIGRDLLARAEAAAAARGAMSLWLTAWVGNARALAFYPRQQYACAGETVYSFEGEDYANQLFVKVLAA